MSDPTDFALPCGGRLSLTAAGAAVTRTDPFGLTLWSAPAPDAADPFVALEIEGEAAVATSRRDVSVRIALADGTVLSTSLIK